MGKTSFFETLQATLEENHHDLPTDHLKALQAFCRNYCIVQYNKGRKIFLQKLFQLYQQHLEQGYLYHDGGLLPSTVRNIVVFGLRCSAYDWVRDFLKKYRHRIVATNEAEEIYQFNWAAYLFAIGEYEKALDSLAGRYEDSYYQLAARRMELKIYYELNLPILDSKINAFKVYIYRVSQKNLPPVPREGNNNFIDILRQICHSKTLNNPDRVRKLIGKVEAKKSVAEKNWLIEKLEAAL